MRKIFIGCLLLWAGHLSAQENSRVASRYMDGRSQAVLRMEIDRARKRLLRQEKRDGP